MRLPRLEGYALVAQIPSSIRRFVAGERFSAIAEDNSPAGTIAVNDEGNSWGYGRFLMRRGADEGDFLRVEFDIRHRVARLALGDRDLLDDADGLTMSAS